MSPTIHRARRLATVLLAVLALALMAAAGASAASVTARQSDSFVESVGVNIHLTYSDSAYNEFTKIKAKLEELGVRNVRDQVSLNRPDVYSEFRQLGQAGIKLDLLVGDPLRRWGDGTVEQQLDMIAKEFPEAVSALEGPNEFDQQGDPNWVEDLRTYQRKIWEGVHARPALAGKTIVAPAVVQRESNPLLGSISQWADAGNMHSYPGGEQPDRDSQMTSELERAAINVGNKPVFATETGYQNDVANRTAGHRPASEAAAGVYMPRLFLDYFRRGIARTYSYELIDLFPDASGTEEWKHFGLLRNDFTPKPAFTSMKRLIALLEDPGPEFKPGSLDYSLSGAPSTVKQLLLQKRDGSFDLVLWNGVSVWNTSSLVPLTPSSSQVTVNLGQAAAQTEVFRPNESEAPVATASNSSSIPVTLSPSVTVIHIVPDAGQPLPELQPEPQPLPLPELTPLPEPEATPPPLPTPPVIVPSPPVQIPTPPRPVTESGPIAPVMPSKSKARALVRKVRSGCQSSCPLRPAELSRARALLRQTERARSSSYSDAATAVHSVAQWLQARAAQLEAEAEAAGNWTLDARGVRIATIRAVLAVAGVASGAPTAA